MIEGQPEFHELYGENGPLRESGWYPCYPDTEFIRLPQELPSIWFEGQLMLGCNQARKVFTAPVTPEAINDTLLTMDYHKDVKYILQKKDSEPVELSEEGFQVAAQRFGPGDAIETKPDIELSQEGLDAAAAMFSDGTIELEPVPEPQAPSPGFVVTFDEYGSESRITISADQYVIDNGMLHFYRNKKNSATFAHGCWKRVIGK